MKKFMTKDRLAGCICIVIAIFFGYASTNIQASLNSGDPGPKLFPLIGCGILLIAGIGMLFRRGSEGPEGLIFTREQWKRALTLFLMYIVYFLLLWLVGYFVAIPIVLFILCLMFIAGHQENVSKGKMVVKAVIYALLVTGLIYLFYVVALKSALPKGLLFR